MSIDQPVSDHFVTIPYAEYRELLAFKSILTGRQGTLEVPSRWKIENDAEVALFLADRFGRMHMETLLDECLSSFGWKRTPSRSAAYRYWRKLRDIQARDA